MRRQVKLDRLKLLIKETPSKSILEVAGFLQAIRMILPHLINTAVAAQELLNDGNYHECTDAVRTLQRELDELKKYI